jgi:hypothetical protein
MDEKSELKSGQMGRGRFERSASFENLYANNVSIESTLWDMHMLFGELTTDEHGEVLVEQHTGMTLPWTLAKILAFHLSVNVIGYEEQNGPIRLPPGMLPFIANLPAMAKSDPKVMAIFTALMVEGNPELFSVDGSGTVTLAEDSEESNT